MWDDFISRQIRRTNRNLFLFGTGILIFLGLLLAAGWRDTYNFIFGPFPVQSSELVSISNPDLPKHFFLKVEGEESFATGMREVDAGNHDKIRAEVIALVVDKRLLLVKTPADNHQLQFTGTLTAVPAELFNGVAHQWDAKHPDLKGAFLPIMLDATGFRKGDNLWVALAGAGFGSGSLSEDSSSLKDILSLRSLQNTAGCRMCGCTLTRRFAARAGARNSAQCKSQPTG